MTIMYGCFAEAHPLIMRAVIHTIAFIPLWIETLSWCARVCSYTLWITTLWLAKLTPFCTWLFVWWCHIGSWHVIIMLKIHLRGRGSRRRLRGDVLHFKQHCTVDTLLHFEICRVFSVTISTIFRAVTISTIFRAVTISTIFRAVTISTIFLYRNNFYYFSCRNNFYYFSYRNNFYYFLYRNNFYYFSCRNNFYYFSCLLHYMCMVNVFFFLKSAIWSYACTVARFGELYP